MTRTSIPPIMIMNSMYEYQNVKFKVPVRREIKRVNIIKIIAIDRGWLAVINIILIIIIDRTIFKIQKIVY